MDHGLVHLGQILSKEEAGKLKEAAEHFAINQSTPGPYGQICHNPWPQVRLLEDTIRNRLAAIAAASLQARDVTLFQDVLIDKPPGSGAVQWHQDYSYWPLDSPRGITFWIALEDADAANGCLHYIPETHLLGEKHPANFFTEAEQPRRPDLEPLDPESRQDAIISMPARAGEVLAHDPLTWHMSPPNTSNRHRQAWSITFVGPDVRWAPDHAPHPFNYDLQPRPGSRLEGELFPHFSV
jgi:phytanoyl-CoA hydroxylase